MDGAGITVSKINNKFYLSWIDWIDVFRYGHLLLVVNGYISMLNSKQKRY